MTFVFQYSSIFEQRDGLRIFTLFNVQAGQVRQDVAYAIVKMFRTVTGKRLQIERSCLGIVMVQFVDTSEIRQGGSLLQGILRLLRQPQLLAVEWQQVLVIVRDAQGLAHACDCFYST